MIVDLLKHVGATGTHLQFMTLDDYSNSIPVSDLTLYDPILAHSRNGKRMTAREFGPSFVIYPRDRYPEELNTPQAQAKFIWQVSRVTVVD